METPVKSVMALAAAVMALQVAITAARTWPPPPAWTDKAKMARYLAHYADWGVVSAVSPDFGYVPFGTLQSFSDGPLENSTGTPYFWMSPMSDTYHSVQYNNSVSLTISQAESRYCEEQQLDPEEPLCSRVTLLGSMMPVKNSEEENFAKLALFSRHPAMKSWPISHDWRTFKLNITAICLLDYYGGATHVSVKDYFISKP